MKSMRRYLIMSLLLISPPIAYADEIRECQSTHSRPIAIFIDPTSSELDEMKRKNSEEDFTTIVDDNLYYRWQAVQYLKERNIPYCFTEDETHAFIDKEKKEKHVMNIECRYWCLILWNGKTRPVWADTAGIFMYESYLTQ